MPVGIGGADHGGHAVQRLGVKLEIVKQRVKAALVAAVAEGHALDVKGDRAEPFGNGFDFGRGHEQKAGTGVDEAADQPGAGDAIDLWPVPGDPRGVGGGQRGKGKHRQTCRFPSQCSAFKAFRLPAH